VTGDPPCQRSRLPAFADADRCGISPSTLTSSASRSEPRPGTGSRSPGRREAVRPGSARNDQVNRCSAAFVTCTSVCIPDVVTIRKPRPRASSDTYGGSADLPIPLTADHRRDAAPSRTTGRAAGAQQSFLPRSTHRMPSQRLDRRLTAEADAVADAAYRGPFRLDTAGHSGRRRQGAMTRVGTETHAAGTPDGAQFWGG
jgi:hypothetical protein